ncbi:DUF3592 domain-containing protein [Deinococcus roseus]|uniref:DUF3592 domain-containing protein n=1 Tax=Deinococcus roseus TaxID=392414 RepID=A0ABQ2CUW2_9DEIO|nr:DUF3592 domain-containing protein [Deinococcus roseus]GGJ23168.1 hypothetical protein GCM10008938_06690 [Deinococcus roseus]
MGIQKAVLIFIMAIGGLFLLGAVWAAGSQWAFLQKSLSANGHVVDLEKGRLSKGGVVYYPFVKYTTRQGKTLIFRNPLGSDPHPDIGDRVTVLYDPQKPASATISSFADLWMIPCILLGLGLCFGGVGWFVFRLSRFA